MDNRPQISSDLTAAERRLEALRAEQELLVERIEYLRSQLQGLSEGGAESGALTDVRVHETTQESNSRKVSLFRSLFRGREDVFPLRWENPRTGKSGYAPACSNEWREGICEKLAPLRRAGASVCGACKSQAFRPVTDEEIARHLKGEQVMGVYPLLRDDTCWFLALDFDGIHWDSDASAFAATCNRYGLQVAIERSRSGQGAHAWFFFTAPVEASLARSFGFFLLSQTMIQRHEISLQSYDRLFPNQDMLPRGGFGNLIALPLQRGPREQGNAVFLGEDLKECLDQWQFLAAIERLTPDRLRAIKGAGGTALFAGGVREGDIPRSPNQPLGVDGEGGLKIDVTGPQFVEMFLNNNLAISKLGMSSPILRGLKNLASFANPEFYQRQRMRLSVARTPRHISCCEEDETILALPRGCKDSAVRFLTEAGSKVTLVDNRNIGISIDHSFSGQLSPVQESAIQDLLLHESGVLVAPPGAGKTVVGCRIVAERKVNTLVIVHRRELLLQWIAQIEVFLGVNRKSIGHIGGGKQLRTGVLDVAMMQSLFQAGKPNAFIAEYGHIVVDECHHCPAFTFERVLSVARAKYFTGLTATPVRRDGRHPIIEMQLGPVRHTIPSNTGDVESAFRRRLIVHATDFRLSGKHEPGIQEIYSVLAADETRNERILDDLILALETHRSPLLLTERRDHLEYFAEKLKTFARNLIVLHGGMTPKRRRLEMSRLAALPGNEERLLIATGRYLGEGFDDARLDTLFLALPVSWKGILVQYAGRLHRMYPGKHEVAVHDYVDQHVPILQKMFEKRLRGYRAMGYVHEDLG